MLTIYICLYKKWKPNYACFLIFSFKSIMIQLRSLIINHSTKHCWMNKLEGWGHWFLMHPLTHPHWQTRIAWVLKRTKHEGCQSSTKINEGWQSSTKINIYKIVGLLRFHTGQRYDKSSSYIIYKTWKMLIFWACC
jgi:hypothetical protein